MPLSLADFFTVSGRRFIYYARSAYERLLEKKMCILVHCTHGFNRTGFMLCSYWLREHAHFPLLPAGQWVQMFAQKRPPGIYKQEYVEDLFLRAREVRPPQLTAAPVPDWKPEDEEDEMQDQPPPPQQHQVGSLGCRCRCRRPRFSPLFVIGSAARTRKSVRDTRTSLPSGSRYARTRPPGSSPSFRRTCCPGEGPALTSSRGLTRCLSSGRTFTGSRRRTTW